MYRPLSQLHQAGACVDRSYGRRSEAQIHRRLCQSHRVAHRLRRTRQRRRLSKSVRDLLRRQQQHRE